MDKPYVHPKDELEKRNAERAGKITEYKALMAAPADEEDLEIEEQLRITYGGCFTPSYGSNIAAGGSAKELPMPPHPPTQGSALHILEDFQQYTALCSDVVPCCTAST
eukprot:CAMPEP_0174329306 /NCGR_PEP_ID=MMETSP0810-20121108/15738_1 /TAXON_ID=73025 ORGANISM="Eutreptiella gymnastica-like, Strain CCMP1594" /NCGR_SAMPLE_ID=MMETSP0810 /ASSEMBLY_ACC=CAM_ASM_000659 /LENGTH=107 /DNA_ID=CAMNT_0015443727 /DNA_START=36 /DNA_END=356 /DNA_ORIENTATION=+